MLTVNIGYISYILTEVTFSRGWTKSINTDDSVCSRFIGNEHL